MTRELYEAAMEAWIDDYLDEHPDAEWQEAADAFMHVEDDYTADYIAARVDDRWQRAKDELI
jgi:hypothetical protein